MLEDLREKRRMDRVRTLIRTRNDYLIPETTSDGPGVELTGAEKSSARPRVMTPKEREREITRLERMAAHREGRIAPSEKEWWETAKERRDRSGSYLELDRLLSTLPWEDVYFLEYYHSGVVSHTEPAKAREDRLVRAIARAMPGRLEIPAGLHEKEMSSLAPLVKQLASKGHKKLEVAKALGISRRRVRSLLKQT